MRCDFRGGAFGFRLGIGVLLAGAVVFGMASGRAEEDVDCPGGDIASFGELAERLSDYDGVTVLSVELLVSPTRACRETWVVEVLTEEGEVQALLLNARTLEDRLVGRIEEEEPDDELFPAHTQLVGRQTADLIEGLWSDDSMRGGQGGDLFVVTPGSDVIHDFVQGEDLLDVGDFARREDGFGVLRSMDDIRRLSESVVIDGRPGTMIDIDGPAGDWSVTLLGIRARQLREESIFFGIEGDAAPDFPVTHWPDRKVEMSDGSVVFFPAYRIDEKPPEGRVLEGDEAVLPFVRDHLLDIYRAFGGED
ncbi:MAG: hypothetical protein AAF074_00515 [Pseudomonadota bacterium]